MTPELRVILAGLAVFRIASLVAQDDGPFNLIRRFRLWLGLRASADRGKGVAWTMGELVHCPYCLGVYAALMVALLVLFASPAADIILLWWGLAGAQALLEGIAGRSR